jgi:hypothetical protein
MAHGQSFLIPRGDDADHLLVLLTSLFEAILVQNRVKKMRSVSFSSTVRSSFANYVQCSYHCW